MSRHPSTLRRALRAVLATATATAVAAGLLASSPPALAHATDIPADYMVESVPASIKPTSTMHAFTFVTGPEHYSRWRTRMGGQPAVYTRDVFDGAGRKTGHWFAFYRDQRALAKDLGYPMRNIRWAYQPYGVYCVNQGSNNFQKVAFDTFTSELGCLPDPELMRTQRGDTWYDTVYAPDNAACAKGNKHAVPRASTGEPLYCYDSAGTMHVSTVSGSHPCAPWEPQATDPKTGALECHTVTYSWMTPEMMPEQVSFKVTRSAGYTASKTVRVMTPTAPVVKRRVRRDTVHETVVRWRDGRKYVGYGKAGVFITRKASVKKRGAATRSVTAVRKASCTSSAREAALQCAEAKAITAAKAAAVAEAHSAATAAAREVAYANSRKASSVRATRLALDAKIPVKKVRKARELATNRAIVDVQSKMTPSF